MTAGAGPPLRNQLTASADRTIRYFRICQLPEPAGRQTPGDVERAAMLTVLGQHGDAAALSGWQTISSARPTRYHRLPA